MEEKNYTYWAFCLFITLFFSSLISSLYSISFNKTGLFFLTAIIIVSIFLFKKRVPVGKWALFILIFSLIFNYFYINEYDSYLTVKKNYKKHIIKSKYGIISGIISSDPEKYRENRVQFELMIQDKKDFRFANGYILKVYVNTKNYPDFYRGEKISFYGRFYPIKKYSNFYNNFLNYYNLSKKIIGSSYVKSDKLILRERIKNYIHYYLSKYKVNFSGFASKIEKNSSDISIVKAVSIGERKSIPEKLKFLWKESGIYHLLAISGAHIGIISFLIFYILRFLRIRNRIIYVFQIVLMLLFMLFIGNNPPVVRASFMIILFFFAKLFWKDTDMLHIISISGIIYLLFNPLMVVNIGFILTYYITILLILILRKMKNVFSISTKLEQAFYIILIAFFVSLPLNLYFFNYLPFGSLILNFAALFIIPPVLFFSILSLLLFTIVPSVAAFFLKVSVSLISIMNTLGRKIGAPLSLRLLTPPFWLVILYTIFLLSIVFVKKRRFIAIILFFITFFLMVFYPERVVKAPSVFFLDVGEGDSSYMEIPKSKNILIDCGGSYKKDNFMGEYVVSDFLFKRRVRTIEAIFISHFHPDHYYGCLRVIKNFKVKKVYYYNTIKGRNINELLEVAKENNTQIVKLSYGENVRIGDSQFRVVHPEKKIIERITNNDSMVLVYEYKGYRILYTGDIEREAEGDIVDRGEDIKSNVLKVAHHGSRTSTTLEFLRSVSPEIAIISVGEGNRYRFPSKYVLKKLKNKVNKVFRTDTDGAIQLIIKKDKINILLSKGLRKKFSFDLF